jgi:hypothetical protein
MDLPVVLEASKFPQEVVVVESPSLQE